MNDSHSGRLNSQQLKAGFGKGGGPQRAEQTGKGPPAAAAVDE